MYGFYRAPKTVHARREKRYKLIPTLLIDKDGASSSSSSSERPRRNADAADLVVGRARRARAAAAAAAAAALKSRERVHETEARRVEDTVLGRRVALHLGVACGRRRVDRVRENASDYAEVGDRPSRDGWLTRIFSSARAAPLAHQPSTDV